MSALPLRPSRQQGPHSLASQALLQHTRGVKSSKSIQGCPRAPRDLTTARLLSPGAEASENVSTMYHRPWGGDESVQRALSCLPSLLLRPPGMPAKLVFK